MAADAPGPLIQEKPGQLSPLPHADQPSSVRAASASVAPESPPREVRTLVAQALELRDDRAILLALKLTGLLMLALGLGLFLILAC